MMLLQYEEAPQNDTGETQEPTASEVIQEELAVDANGYGEYESVPIWLDTYLWTLLPFLCVVLLFWVTGVHKMVGGMLDRRGKTIASELEQARDLREEAQELLAKYQRRQREAEEEAQGIIDQAKRDAKRMAEETRQKLDEQLERRTRAAEDKIARAEAHAIAEVRNRTADVAVTAAEQIVRDRLDTQAGAALVDRAISNVRERLN
nr:ATP synthase subunit b [Aquisalinus luteolus]